MQPRYQQFISKGSSVLLSTSSLHCHPLLHFLLFFFSFPPLPFSSTPLPLHSPFPPLFQSAQLVVERLFLHLSSVFGLLSISFHGNFFDFQQKMSKLPREILVSKSTRNRLHSKRSHSSPAKVPSIPRRKIQV